MPSNQHIVKIVEMNASDQARLRRAFEKEKTTQETAETAAKVREEVQADLINSYLGGLAIGEHAEFVDGRFVATVRA